jgi:hypothetical protein
MRHAKNDSTGANMSARIGVIRDDGSISSVAVRTNGQPSYMRSRLLNLSLRDLEYFLKLGSQDIFEDFFAQDSQEFKHCLESPSLVEFLDVETDYSYIFDPKHGTWAYFDWADFYDEPNNFSDNDPE